MHIPVEIKIGEPYYDSSFTGAKRRLVEKQYTYQYIPLLSSLQSLLSDPSVMDEVEQCQHRVHTDGIIVIQSVSGNILYFLQIHWHYS